MRKKILTSMGILKPEESRGLRPPTPGPHSAGLGSKVPDEAYVKAHAAAKDWAEWRVALEARATSRPINKYLRCDNPACRKTNLWPATAENQPCWFCNNRDEKTGGHLRAMTAEDIATWEIQQKAARDKWAADGPKRRAAADAFNRRRREDRYA